MSLTGSPAKKGNNKLKRLGVNISEVSGARQLWQRREGSSRVGLAGWQTTSSCSKEPSQLWCMVRA